MVEKKPRKSKPRRKPAVDLDDSHALQRLFPKDVRDELKRQAKAANKLGGKRSST